MTRRTMLTALERASWKAYQAYDIRTWDSIYADTFFELLADASFWTKEAVMADIQSQAWETHWFEMSEIRVVPMNEVSALICYKIYADFTWHTTDGRRANRLPSPTSPTPTPVVATPKSTVAGRAASIRRRACLPELTLRSTVFKFRARRENPGGREQSA